MNRHDLTEMGGSQQSFKTTHWTEILKIQTEDGPQQRQFLSEVLTQYWKPIYCYLRRKGNPSEKAKDLTQGFIEEIVLGHDLIQKADRSRGRFRTFLLSALQNYVRNQHDYETARKRRPEKPMVPLDIFDSDEVYAPTAERSPDEEFQLTWAQGLLKRVCDDVEEKCLSTEKQAHWQVFQMKVLAPILEGSEPPALKSLCEKFGIVDEATASGMIYTVKRIYRATLNRHLKQLVDKDKDVEEEWQELLGIFSGS